LKGPVWYECPVQAKEVPTVRDSSRDRRRDDDRALLRACRTGDDRAWTALVSRYRRLIHSIPVAAYRFPEADAEEIFQQVVVKLFENIGRIHSGASLPAWLMTVTRNECRRQLRLSRRWGGAVDEHRLRNSSENSPDMIGALDTIDRQHRLALAFERLDEPSRQLLSAFFLEKPSPSYAAIASRLGRPIGSLGPSRARSLAKLRRIYADLGGGHVGTPAPSCSVGHAAHLRPARAAAV
jgi:RNA polymerase sigma factor (sigma-70 family)